MSDAYRDGEHVLRARWDDLTLQRAALEQELTGVRQQIAEVEARLGRVDAGRGRGCYWVLALPVTIIGLSAWGLLSVHAFVYPRSRAAEVGAQTMAQAADIYRDVEDDVSCPTVEHLVASKKLDARKIEDPWGRPYHIDCSAERVHAVSAGKDGRFFTPDDIRDDFTPAEMRRVAELNH